LFSNGEKSKGLEHLHEANEFKPSNVNVLLDLSSAYLTLFDFDKAMLYIDRALVINPDNQVAQKLKAKIDELHKLFDQGKGVT
jgi:tetratricopeptide (TPR) repeat protein